MCPRLFLRCLETPKPDAEIDVVFGFLLKSGPYTAKISDDLHVKITYCTFVWII